MAASAANLLHFPFAKVPAISFLRPSSLSAPLLPTSSRRRLPLGLSLSTGPPADVVYPAIRRSHALFARGFQVEVEVDDDEDERSDDFIIRFHREVARAGIIYELRRRKHHENSQQKKKRKIREAIRKYRRRRRPRPGPESESKPRSSFTSMSFLGFGDEDEENESEIQYDDDDDNWELPEGL